MALTSYQRIANGDIDPESPVTTSLVTLLRDNPISMLVQAPSAPDMMLRRDPLIMNHGYGSNALVWNSTQDIDFPVIECQSLSIEGGAGVTVSFKRPVTIIRAIETITIDAIIDSSGSTIVGSGESGGASGAGGAGGGSSGSISSGRAGGDGRDGGNSQFESILGGAGGAAAVSGAYNQGSPGADGVDMNAAFNLTLGQLLSYYSKGGANGGNGGEGGDRVEYGYTGPDIVYAGTRGGYGGVGGGLLILIAPTIIFDTQAQVLMQGEDGEKGLNYNQWSPTTYTGSGGGGGGGGGSLVAVTQGVNSLIDNALSKNFAGGAGGDRGYGHSNKYYGDGGIGGVGGNGALYNIELERADEL